LELLALLCSRSETQNVTIMSAMPEHRVQFDYLPGEPRNADVVAVGEEPNGRLAINIEAKADEPFDQYVRDILLSAARRIAADEQANAVIRIQNLAKSILPPRVNEASSLGELRYQLLTGVAGAIAFAAEVGANRAAFLVHEFITDRTDDEKHRPNAQDLDNFVLRLSRGLIASVPSGVLLGPFRIPGLPLFRSAPPLFLEKQLGTCERLSVTCYQGTGARAMRASRRSSRL
jgi:hypothetical protein